ncbi:dienelactone hydrolase family protein [Sphingobium sp. DEHP117]|uniref:dienelactone hydrolase family protein n=1 Tax=Sphingobium sp. DEHP117 TaxID=2993436 RepID=UPI0027D708BD|nr:dienelactone hydrolase family protein [Sphingobium sp. DEHP117]MDQ4419198.1 dienelactone hydrolase family protein [Sphingobium sp. DEHP117]
MAIQQKTLLHGGPGGPFESMAVYDPDAGSQPGLLLFPNFMGTKEWDFDKAEVLAMLGYKVLVVDYYGQGKRATDMESAGQLMQELVADRAVMRDRLLGALEELKKLPGVDANRLGAIGFCLGGKCVLDLARAGADIKGGVVFHGVYDAPPFPNAAITAKLLVCHGWNDPLCPPEAMNALARELTDGGVDWQLIAYGHTGHAFTADNMPMDDAKTFGFQPDTNRRSWQAMKDFFSEIL